MPRSKRRAGLSYMNSTIICSSPNSIQSFVIANNADRTIVIGNQNKTYEEKSSSLWQLSLFLQLVFPDFL